MNSEKEKEEKLNKTIKIFEEKYPKFKVLDVFYNMKEILKEAKIEQIDENHIAPKLSKALRFIEIDEDFKSAMVISLGLLKYLSGESELYGSCSDYIDFITEELSELFKILLT